MDETDEHEKDELHIARQKARARTVFDELINGIGIVTHRAARRSRMTPLERFTYDRLQNDRAKAVIEGMLDGDAVSCDTESHEQVEKMNHLIVENLDVDSIWAFAFIASSVLKDAIFDEVKANETNLQAREYALIRLAKDPKQREKASVRECWELWQKEPERYKSKAAFGKDMLLKYESLESQRVIERWCKEWESVPF